MSPDAHNETLRNDNSQPQLVMTNDNSMTRKYMHEIDQLLRKKGNQGSIETSGEIKQRSQNHSQAEILIQGGRSKSRGKGISSKEKQRLRDNGNHHLEELKRQMFIKSVAASTSGFDSSGNTRRKTTGGRDNSGNASQKLILDSNQQSQWLGNAHQILMAQQQQDASSQQWLQANPQNVSGQNSQIKLNTHQLIKKFLNDRQQQQIVPQVNSGILQNNDNYSTNPSTNQDYKLQLSRKILQQQQKLLGGGPVLIPSRLSTQGPIVKNDHTSNVIKRSSTPMIELNDFGRVLIPPTQTVPLPATTTGVPGKQLAMVPEGKSTPDLQSKLSASMSILRDYQSVEKYDLNTSYSNEGQITSEKKKILARKSHNQMMVPSNSQQSWQ